MDLNVVLSVLPRLLAQNWPGHVRKFDFIIEGAPTGAAPALLSEEVTPYSNWVRLLSIAQYSSLLPLGWGFHLTICDYNVKDNWQRSAFYLNLLNF